MELKLDCRDGVTINLSIIEKTNTSNVHAGKTPEPQANSPASKCTFPGCDGKHSDAFSAFVLKHLGHATRPWTVDRGILKRNTAHIPRMDCISDDEHTAIAHVNEALDVIVATLTKFPNIGRVNDDGSVQRLYTVPPIYTRKFSYSG